MQLTVEEHSLSLVVCGRLIQKGSVSLKPDDVVNVQGATEGNAHALVERSQQTADRNLLQVTTAAGAQRWDIASPCSPPMPSVKKLQSVQIGDCVQYDGHHTVIGGTARNQNARRGPSHLGSNI